MVIIYEDYLRWDEREREITVWAETTDAMPVPTKQTQQVGERWWLPGGADKWWRVGSATGGEVAVKGMDGCTVCRAVAAVRR